MRRFEVTTTQLARADSIAWEPWQSHAACRGHDPEWWADDMAHRRQAVAICIQCPVRPACLADAERQRDVGVVRGGVLLREVRGRRKNVWLICARCQRRPASIGGRVVRRYCAQCQPFVRARRNWLRAAGAEELSA